MKVRKSTIPVLLLIFILSIFLPSGLSAQKKKKQKEKAQEPKPLTIPPMVKSVLEEGMKTREARLDIPFTIIKNIYLPARGNMHTIFFFKVKNADLQFFPVAPPPVSPEKKEEKEKEKEVQPEAEIAPTQLRSNTHLFLQFNRLEKGAPVELVKEIYIPISFQVEMSSYNPDKEEIYTTAYPFPPGNYILSMAITSRNLDKIGTQYFEFSLPDEAALTEGLYTTPIFFIKNVKSMTSPEIQPEIHKGFFTYSILQIEANIERILSSGESFELLFYVLGAQTLETGKSNIEINYEVLKGEKKAILYAPGTYESALVSQPLHLKQTVVIKSEAGERQEVRDLKPGTYTLSIKITDKISGKSVTKTIDFEVK